MTQFVYLSNALSGTITRYQLSHGVLTFVGETYVGEMVMPMTISQCKNFLYAAVRSQPYRIVQFKIERKTGALTKGSELKVDESIVSLDVDSKNRWLLAASFNHNRLSVKALQDSGKLSGNTAVVQHQAHCHMFRFSPDEEWMVATEFGRDKIYVYPSPKTDEMVAVADFEYDFPKGSGPRHLVFSPCGSFLYVLTEMSATVTTFAFDKVNGILNFVAETPILPLDDLGLEIGLPPAKRIENDVPRVWAADIHITQSGRFVYVSERTLSVISCLEVTKTDPVPQYRYHQAVERQPRSFMLTPDDKFMLVSGELADELGVYEVDASNGTMVRVSSAQCGEGAAWVCGISMG